MVCAKVRSCCGCQRRAASFAVPEGAGERRLQRRRQQQQQERDALRTEAVETPGGCTVERGGVIAYVNTRRLIAVHPSVPGHGRQGWPTSGAGASAMHLATTSSQHSATLNVPQHRAEDRPRLPCQHDTMAPWHRNRKAWCRERRKRGGSTKYNSSRRMGGQQNTIVVEEGKGEAHIQRGGGGGGGCAASTPQAPQRRRILVWKRKRATLHCTGTDAPCFSSFLKMPILPGLTTDMWMQGRRFPPAWQFGFAPAARSIPTSSAFP